MHSTRRDFATPPTHERGDEIALKCRTSGKVTTGRFYAFHGGVYYIYFASARMVRSRSVSDYHITAA